MPDITIKLIAGGLFVCGVLLAIWGVWLFFSGMKDGHDAHRDHRLTYGRDGK